jgi:beta-barrel assembly-enhancing protease
MKRTLVAGFAVASLTVCAPAWAQLGGLGKALDKAKQAKDTVDSLTFTEAEERQLGTEISAKLRDRFGVVQDREVHKYVTLVGRVLAANSSRSTLQWTFVVLDTDGVNAFAAPGGFIHITKGALALIQSEGELADVLAHEIAHVTEKHTINAITNATKVKLGSKALSGNEKIAAGIEQGYGTVLENNFDRGDEMEADRVGITLANKSGYAPTGLAAFLTRLADRNKNLKERSGMFASHPESKARLDGLTKVISQAKLTATAQVAPRYAQFITFKPVAVSAVPQTGATTTASTAKPAQSGGGRFGLSNLTGQGRDKNSDSVSSAGSRGVNPDRDAVGGPVKTLVAVSVTSAEIETFKKGITS